jgi:hypothetical protein
MLRTLVTARLTDICAKRADCCCVFTVASHEGCRHAADIGTVNVKRDAARHHLNVVFVEARCCTMITSRRTLIAGLNTGSVLFMRHGQFLVG